MMKRKISGARALLAAVPLALLGGCGGNNTYSPDFNSGAAPSLSVTVGPSSVTTTAGQDATFTVTVSGSPGCGDAVALTATGLPQGAAASFSPSSVTPTAQGVTSTLTITTQPGTGDLNGEIRSVSGDGGGSRAGRAVSTITVTGTGCGLTDSGSAQLDVQPASNGS